MHLHAGKRRSRKDDPACSRIGVPGQLSGFFLSAAECDARYLNIGRANLCLYWLEPGELIGCSSYFEDGGKT